RPWLIYLKRSRKPLLRPQDTTSIRSSNKAAFCLRPLSMRSWHGEGCPKGGVRYRSPPGTDGDASINAPRARQRELGRVEAGRGERARGDLGFQRQRQPELVHSRVALRLEFVEAGHGQRDRGELVGGELRLDVVGGVIR